MTATRTRCRSSRRDPARIPGPGPSADIEGNDGPHLHVAGPGAADLRVGREDGRRDRRTGRRLQLPRHRHRSGRQRGQRGDRQHHHRHPPHPVQLSVDLSYFSPNGDGVKDTLTFGLNVPVATRDREVDPRLSRTPRARRGERPSRAPSPSRPRSRGTARTTRARRCPKAPYKGKLSVDLRQRPQSLGRFPGCHHQADGANGRGEGGVRRLLPDGRQPAEHGGDLPGHLLGAVLDRHVQGQRRQGREDTRVARQGRRQVRMGRPRR